ncbi:MAG: hypothetical protein NC432_07615, partial [Roseburia sp.]|nr:hypothetical protein [Roseburia sp.]MCM1099056.1 hypothetical protein [Ruminococcus flavefaciens]
LQFVWNEKKGREEADMCYALDQIMKSERKQGVKEGKLEGRQEGIKQGVQQGRQQISKLFERLLADGRLKELSRAATDERFQRKLLKEYGI